MKCGDCRFEYRSADSLYATLSGPMIDDGTVVAGFRLNPDGTVASGQIGDTEMACVYRGGYLYTMALDRRRLFYIWENGNLVFQSGLE